MFRTLVFLAVSGCVAQQPVRPGPSFGGDLSFHAAREQLDAGVLPEPDSLTEAGLLSSLPVPIGQMPCPERLCLSTSATWVDEDLLVGIGFDGTPVRPPVELAFVLDASGSTVGSEDVRAATVEIALDAMGPEDRLAIWAFTGDVAPLVPSGPVDPERTRRALEALDLLEPFSALLRSTPAESLEELLDELVLLEAEDAEIDLVLDLLDRTEDDPGLEQAMFVLASTSGSAIDLAVDEVLQSLPDGTETRASRMVLVSDFDGPSVLELIEEAATHHIGTSVLGVTADADTDEMNRLAAAPGAHTFDAPEPSVALARWEKRFDALVAPNAWSVQIELASSSRRDWALVRQFGHPIEDGANAWFGGSGHGAMAVVLRPLNEDPSQPEFEVQLTTADDTIALRPWSRIPVRLLNRPWGQGDDEVALGLAWRMALFDAIANGDEAALDLWSARPETEVTSSTSSP